MCSECVEEFSPVGHRAWLRDTDPWSQIPTINTEALVKVLDHVETLAAFENEGVRTDRWRQSFWGISDYTEIGSTEICGTAACFAGWTLLDHGYTVEGSLFRGPDGRFANPEEDARRLLGLTDHEAGTLFRGDNELADVQTVVSKLLDCAEREAA